jgi:energy-converting hydrogenase Eha subunit E
VFPCGNPLLINNSCKWLIKCLNHSFPTIQILLIVHLIYEFKLSWLGFTWAEFIAAGVLLIWAFW